MEQSENYHDNNSGLPFESRLKVQELNHLAYRIRNELSKVIVGQERVLDLLLTALLRFHSVVRLVIFCVNAVARH